MWMELPCCSIGGLSCNLAILVSGFIPDQEPRARILAVTLTVRSLPTCTVMLPAPDSTSNLTGPETCSTREKLPVRVSPRLQEASDRARGTTTGSTHNLFSLIRVLFLFLRETE